PIQMNFLKKILKFEPIDLTQIIITMIVLFTIIYAFKTQLNDFFASLKDRPITVEMSGSEAKIHIDVPAATNELAQSVSNPETTRDRLDEWEQDIEHMDDIRMFRKLGFEDLYQRMSTLGPNDFAAINYAVNDPGKNYFRDQSMLKYLSIASEKISYLAFYEDNKFQAVIKTQKVIAGLASDNSKFRSFGNKLKNGKWRNFPGLITRSSSFTHTPTVRELQEFLITNNLTEIPLIQNDRLAGFLNYKSISSELYAQASEK
ncbi:MAG: hypothetical protein ABFR82_16950, partial [Nitrospirota bacterium]